MSFLRVADEKVNMDTIFFDLDGTLTDPKHGITRCIQYALETIGVPAPTTEELLWCIGPPLRASLVRLLGDDARADEALALYRARFTEIGLYENAVYDGVPEMLEHLQRAGRRLFVATSKPRVYAQRIVRHFGLDGAFEVVFGSELDGTRVDKTELLAHALRETGAAPERSAMIGDREHDMIGACNNSLVGIGVLYGYGSPEALREAGARHVVDHPDEVPGLF